MAVFLNKHKSVSLILQAFIIITSFSFLLKSESYVLPYMLIVIAAFLCMIINFRQGISLLSGAKIIRIILAALFAFMITYANYDVWSSISLFDQNILNILVAVILNIIIWLGVFLAFLQILLWISYYIPAQSWKEQSTCKPLTIFFITFGIVAGIDLILLFTAKYPGILSPDSLDQVQQILSGQYNNHHPVAHTFIIKLCMDLGMALFHDINAAIAVYSVFSILLVAVTFAFSVATIAEIKAPRWILILLICFYALMPYHILYSMTMWKDVFYGVCVLQFAIFFFRLENRLSLPRLNYVGLFLSSLGICLFRSNGLFSFVITLICFICLWQLKNRKALFIMLGVLLCSLIIKYPVLKAMNIEQSDIVEYLSIPEQQMARDVIENDDFTSEQLSLLSNVVEVERIPEMYLNYRSEPIKALIGKDESHITFMENHLPELGQLYISRILKHPFTYLSAWIDQTKGYWNSGYTYPRWNTGVYENNMGIESTVYCAPISNLFAAYYGAFQHIPVTQLFISIGFFNWILLLTFFISILRKDKTGVMLCMPSLATILSLLISTPIFSEFRYNYEVFCVLPVLLVFALRPIYSHLPVADNSSSQ